MVSVQAPRRQPARPDRATWWRSPGPPRRAAPWASGPRAARDIAAIRAAVGRSRDRAQASVGFRAARCTSRRSSRTRARWPPPAPTCRRRRHRRGPRPGGESVEQLIAAVAGELGRPVLADVDSLEAATSARRGRCRRGGHDAGGLHRRRARCPPSRTWSWWPGSPPSSTAPCWPRAATARPTSCATALAAGALAVVVGTAITDPMALTRRFAAATRRLRWRARPDRDGLPRRLPGGPKGQGLREILEGLVASLAAGLRAALRAAAGRALRPGPDDRAHRGRPAGRRRLGLPPAREAGPSWPSRGWPRRACSPRSPRTCAPRAGARLDRDRAGDHRGHDLPGRRARDRSRGPGGPRSSECAPPTAGRWRSSGPICLPSASPAWPRPTSSPARCSRCWRALRGHAARGPTSACWRWP